MMKFVLCIFSILAVAGCHSGDSVRTPVPESSHAQPTPSPALSTETSFSQLKQKLEQGRYEDVMDRAGTESQRMQIIDPVWAWKFRLLQARANVRALYARDALALLANMQPPAGLPIEEFAQKDIIAAEAECMLEKKPEGISLLQQAKPLLSADPVLNADWFFIRGKCEPWESNAARSFYEKAWNMARGRDKFLEATSEGNLAYSLSRRQHFDEALDHYKPVLKLARDMGSPVLEERALAYMGQAYYELGEYRRAIQYATLSEKLAANLGRIDHQSRGLIDIGVDEQSRGRLTEAEDYYLQAIRLAGKVGDRGIRDDIIARSLNNLTVVELQKQSFEKAEDFHRQAAGLKKSGDDLLTWNLAQIDLALARKDFSAAQTELTQLLSSKEQGFRLRWAAQQRKAEMYELMGNLKEAEKSYRETIQTALDATTQLNHQEYKTSFLSKREVFSDFIEFLVRTNRPNEALHVAEIGRARALATQLDHRLPTEDTKAWLENIQNGLKHSGKVALAYWESRTQLYTWTVTASEVKLVQQAYGARELERLVGAYQKEIEDHKSPGASPAAARLYNILIEPSASLIPHGSQVVIIAHGNLYEINFESLIVPSPVPHYWIEDVILENAISLNHVITSNRPDLHFKKDMLAIGAAIQVEPEFPLLLNAPEEIARVTKFFPPGLEQVFTAEQATPQAFLHSNLEEYRYIHVAAHATNVALEPMDSAIVLSPDHNHSYKLYARDIADLKRAIHTELVTISACNSAGTPVNDLGGPVGLSSAFISAGAHQVIAALWQVDDAAMPILMGQFYGGLVHGKTANEALHDAKLILIKTKDKGKSYDKPFYWATLQLYSRS